MSAGSHAAAAAIPGGVDRSLPGQNHGPANAVLVPVPVEALA